MASHKCLLLLQQLQTTLLEVYKNPTVESLHHPYMKHQVFKTVSSLNFCPYEDVLGVGHGAGFSSMLDKISPDLISVDREALGGVDMPTLEEKIQERNKKLFIKPVNIDFDPRQKMKGKQGSAKRHHIRRTVIEQSRGAKLRQDLIDKDQRREGQSKKSAPVYKNILNRFK